MVSQELADPFIPLPAGTLLPPVEGKEKGEEEKGRESEEGVNEDDGLSLPGVRR